MSGSQLGLHSPLLTLLASATLACAAPTAIDVTVYSEVPCSAQAEIALSVAGDLQSLAGAAPASVATRCDDVGDVTPLYLLPPYRNYNIPSSPGPNLGFRCARTP